MTTRDTLLGLLVVGLVLAGVFWARGWGPARERAPGAAASSRALDAAAEATMPDLTTADGIVDLGSVRVTLSVAPRPPVAFVENRFRVRVTSNGAPVALDDGRISFEMTMPMGKHRYALVGAVDGWQEADVVLPMCPSGKRRWYATVEGTVAGRPIKAAARFDLASPSSTTPATGSAISRAGGPEGAARAR